MNIMSVGKPSAKRHISPYTRETIQEKDPIHVVNAEKEILLPQVSSCDHQRTHTGKLYKCNECGKSPTTDHLITHPENTHRREALPVQ